MHHMGGSGEADALVPERVGQEVSRGLMEKVPSRMVAVLVESGAFARVLRELEDALERNPGSLERLATRIDHAAAMGAPLPVRYAALLLDATPEEVAALSARINAPSECRELAVLATREREGVARPETLVADQLLSLLERADAFRRPERLQLLVSVAQADAGVHDAEAFDLRQRLERAHRAARAVDAGVIAREHPDDIPGAIQRARLAAIAAVE